MFCPISRLQKALSQVLRRTPAALTFRRNKMRSYIMNPGLRVSMCHLIDWTEDKRCFLFKATQAFHSQGTLSHITCVRAQLSSGMFRMAVASPTAFAPTRTPGWLAAAQMVSEWRSHPRKLHPRPSRCDRYGWNWISVVRLALQVGYAAPVSLSTARLWVALMTRFSSHQCDPIQIFHASGAFCQILLFLHSWEVRQLACLFKSKLSSLLTLGHVLKWHVICASCLSGWVSCVCLVSPTPSVLWDQCPSGLSSPCSISGIEANLALRLASTVLTGSFSA